MTMKPSPTALTQTLTRSRGGAEDTWVARGHSAKEMIGSLRALYPCVKEGGFYVIEDVMCGTWSNTENIYFEGKSVFQHLAGIYESMHAHFADMFPDHHKNVYDPIFSKQVRRIHLLDSLAVFEKGVTPTPSRLLAGDSRVAYYETVSQPVSLNQQRHTLDIHVGQRSDRLDLHRIHAEVQVFCEKVMQVSSPDELAHCTKRVLTSVLETAFYTSSSDRALRQLVEYEPPIGAGAAGAVL